MHFFRTLKAQHIALLITQPADRFNWRLLGVFALVVLLSGGLLYGVFGDQILTELMQVFNENSQATFSLDVENARFLLWGIPVIDFLSEVVWIATVAFVTVRVLKYLKKPLRFKQVCNIYLLIRVYELLVGFALLLGFSVVSLSTGIETVPMLQTEPGIMSVFISFIIPVYFFWMYLWSIRFTTKQMMTIAAIQKEDKTK